MVSLHIFSTILCPAFVSRFHFLFFYMLEVLYFFILLMTKKIYTHPDEAIILNIRFIRWQRVLLDSDLAKFYWVPTMRLNEAVKRNKDRFPQDFMFQLTENEVESYSSQHTISDSVLEQGFLRSQIATSNIDRWEADSLISQIAISNVSSPEAHSRSFSKEKPSKGRWWTRKLPYAFTEQWIAMLSSVLHSPTAIKINIQIIRIFVKMREILASHKELLEKIEAIEASLWSTNAAVQELYSLFITLVEQDTKDKERKIGFIKS